jgi:zinc transport system permease protein
MSSLFSYEFMRLAFAAVLFITPLLGILGTMVVRKKMAFFSDALGHSALTGIALGIFLGISDPSLSMVIYGIVFALLLTTIQRRNLSSTDTIISVFASGSTAIGLAILSHGGNFSNYSALLIGDILSIKKSEVLWLLVILCVTVVFWILAVNRLNAISIHATLARSANIQVKLIEDIFSILIAVVVMLSIRWIGILLISALMIIPPASSANISQNMREYHLYSIIFAVFSGVVGLIVSYYTNVATGPMIVIIAAVIYFATYLYGRKGK